MATAKKKVIMRGEGNFSINDTTYSFTDGEEVTAKSVAHVTLLKAEADRRAVLQNIAKPKDTKG